MSFADINSPMEFNFEGQFLGFASQDGTLKYLCLKVLSEEMQIKIPKAMRSALGRSLQPGEAIRVIGMGKLDHHAHVLKLKATQIIPLAEQRTQILPAIESIPASPMTLVPSAKPNRAKIKVLLCQKSGCLKRGGKELGEALKQILRDRRLEQYVTIERTGCLKCCSSAPNLTIMPGNDRYKDVRLKTLPQIVDAIAQKLANHK